MSIGSESDGDAHSEPVADYKSNSKFVSNKPQHEVLRHDNHSILYSSNEMQCYDMS